MRQLDHLTNGVQYPLATSSETPSVARKYWLGVLKTQVLDEAKVHFFGDNFAVVYGREHAIGKDKSQPNAKVCQSWTDTWLKRDGKWQIVASQDNRVECK